MTEKESFSDLIRRVRGGDDGAAEQIIRQYEPELRIMARVRLSDPSLHRVLDSMDICQSIMANFFVRVSCGEFEIESPQQLKNLLATMLKNKITDHARRQKADRRDARRLSQRPADEIPLAAQAETPSQVVAARDLLDRVHTRLTDEERELVERRRDGASWEQLAKELDGTPEGLRKRHARALQRVTRELGLDDEG